MEKSRFGLFCPFKPDRKVISLYNVIFAVAFALFGLVLLAAAFLSESVPFLAISVIVLVAIAAFYLFWVGKYYDTVLFELKDDEVTWRRGVWFRMTGIVPYDRITNIDIYQGPLMRHFGFSCIKIQTAGYSAQANRSEITLEGIVEAEELRERLRALIRETRKATGPTDATGTPARLPVPAQSGDPILEEVRAIRRLLEERR